MNKLGLNLIEDKKVEKNKENEKKRKIYKDNLIKFIKIYNTRVSIFTSSKPPSSLVPEFKKIIKLAKELVEKNNSKLF